jgi:hypothetical protein
MDYSTPRYLIYTGIFGATLVGCAQPVWAIFYSKLITYMTSPLKMMPIIYSEKLLDGESGEDFIIRQSYYTVGAAFVLVAFNGFGYFMRNQSFGTLSENLTVEI